MLLPQQKSRNLQLRSTVYGLTNFVTGRFLTFFTHSLYDFLEGHICLDEVFRTPACIITAYLANMLQDYKLIYS